MQRGSGSIPSSARFCCFFIIKCLADLLCSANSERSALLTSHSLGVKSSVINICFK